LSEHPDLLCGGLIQTMTKNIFSNSLKPNVTTPSTTNEESNTTSNTTSKEGINEDNMASDFTKNSQSQSQSQSQSYSQTSRNPFYCDPFELSKLFFVVGHTAIKHIVHLENIENELKRRKASGNIKSL